MAQQTLEQEFMERVFLHRAAILGGYIESRFYKRRLKKGIERSSLEDEADLHSNKVMERALEKGIFNNLYEKAWRELVNDFPENFSVTIE